MDMTSPEGFIEGELYQLEEAMKRLVNMGLGEEPITKECVRAYGLDYVVGELSKIVRERCGNEASNMYQFDFKSFRTCCMMSSIVCGNRRLKDVGIAVTLTYMPEGKGQMAFMGEREEVERARKFFFGIKGRIQE